MVTGEIPGPRARTDCRRARGLCSVVALAAGLAGCPSVAPPLVEVPEYAPTGQRKCSVAASSSEPLIVEWPATQRAKLEALASHGAVVVRYQGCEMTLLGQCHVARRYAYTPTTQHRERVTIRDADQLYASLPLGAASLEAELGKSGELVVDMTIVGRFEAEQGRLTEADLEGECDGATHVVRALTVGAFEFYAAGKAQVGAGAAVAGAEAGARSEASKTLLRQGGKPGSCERSASDDAAPPFECGALLRLEVERIVPAEPEAAAVAPSAPASGSAEPAQAATVPSATSTDSTVPPSEPGVSAPEPVASAGPSTGSVEPAPAAVAPSSAPTETAAASAALADGPIPVDPSVPVDSSETTDTTGWEILGYVAGGLLVAGLVVVAVVGAVAGSDEEEAYVPQAGGLGEVTVGVSWPLFSW